VFFPAMGRERNPGGKMKSLGARNELPKVITGHKQRYSTGMKRVDWLRESGGGNCRGHRQIS